MDFIGFISVVGAFTSILVFLNLFFKTRHRERLALIKYGKDQSVFKGERKSDKRVLKWALTLMGAGTGMLLGGFIDMIFHFEPLGTLSCIMIFGGLFLYYYYQNYAEPASKKEEEDELI